MAAKVRSSSPTYRLNRSVLVNSRFSALVMASSADQKMSDSRASGLAFGWPKSFHAKPAAAAMITALTTIISAEMPSARSMMPSGGWKPPTT